MAKTNSLPPADVPASWETNAAGNSFRDPSGAVVPFEGRILRFITADGSEQLKAFLGTRAASTLLRGRKLPGTEVLGEAETRQVLANSGLRKLFDDLRGKEIVEHERIPFASFPYEWPPAMLYAAAELTINIAIDCLEDGFCLKDATPLNILFRGPEPVFIDLLSFEPREPGDPVWLPYGQFVRTFLLPLLVQRHLRISPDLVGRRDGLEPEEVFRWLGPVRKLLPPFLNHVSIPTWLGSRHNEDDRAIYGKKRLDNPEKARFILRSLLKGLAKSLRSAEPERNSRSVWSDYMEVNNNYSAEQSAAKRTFVQQVLDERKPRRVLDVGCNTGHFSAMAARSGASVVAIDYDPVVAGNVWNNARTEGLDILPLVVNLARPTPAMGWRNQEWPSFLQRAERQFDTVLMLAVLHHLLVTERVPLGEVLSLAAGLTTDLLVIEFIEPDDSMFRRLTRGRDELHQGLSTESFEAACNVHFEVIRSQRVADAKRVLYLLRKKKQETHRISE